MAKGFPEGTEQAHAQVGNKYSPADAPVVVVTVVVVVVVAPSAVVVVVVVVVLDIAGLRAVLCSAVQCCAVQCCVPDSVRSRPYPVLVS